MPSSKLEADYASPTGTHKFTIKTEPSTSETTTPAAAASAQLGALRMGIVQMQSDINAFLTAKMEDEKTGGNTTKEEEMYGEEEAGEE